MEIGPTPTEMLWVFFGITCLTFQMLTAIYAWQVSKDLKLIRSLIAAFMEHKVAPTVAENKLASLVQEANKKSAWE
jgi:hypothetical protein